jgi:hypothetical protein
VVVVVAYGGNTEVVRLLIESGADVNAQLQVGKYGSALAANWDDQELLRLLIESRANMTHRREIVRI